MTIEELLRNYFLREAKVSEQLGMVEQAEAEKRQVPMPEISVPNYAEEVIRPILTMISEALPEYDIVVPTANQCMLINELYQIRAKRVCLGGLSYPTKKDHKLYFASTFHRKAGKRQEVKTLEQLVEQVKIELNKRGLLILPDHL